MLRFRNVVILAVVAAGLIGLVILVQREPAEDPAETGPMLPGLQARLTEVASITVSGHDGAFTVARQDQRWTVTDRDDYPAQSEAVRATLLGIAGMQRVEVKTGRAERYAKLQVEDITQADARSVLFELHAADGAGLAQLILGKARPTTGDPGQREYYVRLGGEAQSWLVRTEREPRTELLEWLEQPVFEIDPARIRRVTVEHPGGEVVTVERSSPDGGDFSLSTLPEGRQVKYQFAVNDVAGSFASLRLNDVRRAAGLDFGGATRALMETVDGLGVRLETVVMDGQRFARLAAFAVEPGARPTVDKSSEAGHSGESGSGDETSEAGHSVESGSGDETSEAGHSVESGSGDESSEAGHSVESGSGDETSEAGHSVESGSGDETSEIGSSGESDSGDEAVAQPGESAPVVVESVDLEQQVAALNARWEGWAYRLDEFDLGNIIKPLSELVEDAGAADPPPLQSEMPAQ